MDPSSLHSVYTKTSNSTHLESTSYVLSFIMSKTHDWDWELAKLSRKMWLDHVRGYICFEVPFWFRQFSTTAVNTSEDMLWKWSDGGLRMELLIGSLSTRGTATGERMVSFLFVFRVRQNFQRKSTKWTWRFWISIGRWIDDDRMLETVFSL